MEHYKTFKKFYKKTPVQVNESNVFDKVKNIFVELKDAGSLDMTAETLQNAAYQKAMETEKEAIPSMRKKRRRPIPRTKSRFFLSFAKKERRHYKLLENVIDFVARPQEWPENADFAYMGGF